MSGESNVSRRGFIKTAAAVSAAMAVTGLGTNFAHADATDTIKVGLIGCGGRGTGAAQDCVKAGKGIEIVALGDLFSDRINDCKANLKKEAPDNYKVSDEKCFTGFDAYKKVIDSGVDLVILATCPCFRPIHLKAAVEAGKHVFMEKPVAVDPVGVRSVIASAQEAKTKKLAIVTGTQRRHDAAYNEVISRIHDGAIGEIVSANCYWNQGPLWMKPRQKAWSDMEWQIRNWIYFTWLGGDHIVEQHVHNIDVMNWCIGDHPESAYGMGGRQARTDPAYGHVYDHFAVEYAYKNDVRVTSMCRQIEGCTDRVGEFVVGTKGTSDPSNWIKGDKPYKFDKKGSRNPYQQEHVDLIESIRKGDPLNEGQRIAETTLTAIMGRMSAYTGKLVTWDEAMKSELNLMPAKLELGPLPVAPVAIPGKQKIA